MAVHEATVVAQADEQLVKPESQPIAVRESNLAAVTDAFSLVVDEHTVAAGVAEPEAVGLILDVTMVT